MTKYKSLTHMLSEASRRWELSHNTIRSGFDQKYTLGYLDAAKDAVECRLTAAEFALIQYVLNENVSPPEGTDDLSILAQQLRKERVQ